MDLLDTPSEAAFRARLRAWLAANVPSDPEPATLAERWPRMRNFQRRMYQDGWVALSWPVEYGGQGLGPVEEAILSQELGRTQAPAILPISHLGRPLLSYGTQAQRARYLPALLGCEEIWCQGFSEPEAGSDLASLRTRAELDGEEWVLSGHKVWTSFGSFSDFCLLLARTDPDAPKHGGISAFILPLETPGVEVRPIVLANGDEEFAEVFLDAARIPADHLLGGPGDGWKIAMEVVAYERGAVDIGYLSKFEREFEELVHQTAARQHDPLIRQAIGEIAMILEVLRLHSLRSLSQRADGVPPGAETSIDKLLMTEVEQLLTKTAVQLSADWTSEARGHWFDRYLYGRASSIYGGTSQIQKTILAQRALGLPRS